MISLFFLPLPMQVFWVAKERDPTQLVQGKKKTKTCLFVRTHADCHWKTSVFLSSLCLCLSPPLHGLLFLPPSGVFTLLSPPTDFPWSASGRIPSAPVSTRLTGKSYPISNTKPHTQVLFKPSHKSHQSSDSLWIDCTSISAKPWSNQPCIGRRGGVSGSRGYELATMTTGLPGTLSLTCSYPLSQVMTTVELNWATSRMKLPPRPQEVT